MANCLNCNGHESCMGFTTTPFVGDCKYYEPYRDVDTKFKKVLKPKNTPPMSEYKPPKEECEFCKDNIFYNGNTFFMEIETGEWDDYYDMWKSVDLDGLKYCPYCGKELKESDYE